MAATKQLDGAHGMIALTLADGKNTIHVDPAAIVAVWPAYGCEWTNVHVFGLSLAVTESVAVVLDAKAKARSAAVLLAAGHAFGVADVGKSAAELTGVTKPRKRKGKS